MLPSVQSNYNMPDGSSGYLKVDFEYVLECSLCRETTLRNAKVE